MEFNFQQIEDRIREAYASAYAYFQNLSTEEMYGWIAIALGIILIIIGILML